MEDATILGLNVLDLITFLFAAAAVIAVVAVWSSTVQRDPMRGRVKALQARREALKSGFIAPKKRARSARADSVGAMRGVVDKLKLLQSEQTKKTTILLSRAGFRNKDAVVIFLFAKLVTPVLFAIIAVVLVYGVRIMEENAFLQLMLALGIILLGFYMPDIVIKNFGDKRRDAIRKALPDALDLMVICAEAGLTLDSALNRVARELTNANPELSDEFSLTAIELGFLTERRQALLNMAERIDLKAVRGVVNTLIQTEKYGTPLAQSLRVLSAEFRNERMMRAEEKAARLPAIMTIPLILFILPTLFIVLLGPAACQISDQFVDRFPE
ncbi:MAG: type II secretion system F family protein [Proteobacteria bacterium]|nr:type II secretion system F family protein [Pseudomonadota bacterium]